MEIIVSVFIVWLAAVALVLFTVSAIYISAGLILGFLTLAEDGGVKDFWRRVLLWPRYWG